MRICAQPCARMKALPRRSGLANASSAPAPSMTTAEVRPQIYPGELPIKHVIFISLRRLPSSLVFPASGRPPPRPRLSLSLLPPPCHLMPQSSCRLFPPLRHSRFQVRPLSHPLSLAAHRWRPRRLLPQGHSRPLSGPPLHLRSQVLLPPRLMLTRAKSTTIRRCVV